MRATRSTACMHTYIIMRANATCNQCACICKRGGRRVARPARGSRVASLACSRASRGRVRDRDRDRSRSFQRALRLSHSEWLTTVARLHCWSCVEIFSRKSAGRDRARKTQESAHALFLLHMHYNAHNQEYIRTRAWYATPGRFGIAAATAEYQVHQSSLPTSVCTKNGKVLYSSFALGVEVKRCTLSGEHVHALAKSRPSLKCQCMHWQRAGPAWNASQKDRLSFRSEQACTVFSGECIVTWKENGCASFSDDTLEILP